MDDPQKDLIDVAVEGTKNVLNSVVQSRGQVRRVILTSSVAGSYGSNEGLIVSFGDLVQCLCPAFSIVRIADTAQPLKFLV